MSEKWIAKLRILENFNDFRGILTFDRAYTRLLQFKSRSHEKAYFLLTSPCLDNEQ